MSNSLRLFLAAVLLQLSGFLPIRGQVPVMQACTQVKDEIKCDEPSFSAALKAAKTVAIATRPENRASERALSSLIRDLGKTEQPEPADLTFELVRNEQSGLFYGPGDRLLAILRVYAHGAPGGRGPLVWVESYAGEPDVPWPSVAHRALEQFKSEFK